MSEFFGQMHARPESDPNLAHQKQMKADEAKAKLKLRVLDHTLTPQERAEARAQLDKMEKHGMRNQDAQSPPKRQPPPADHPKPPARRPR